MTFARKWDKSNADFDLLEQFGAEFDSADHKCTKCPDLLSERGCSTNFINIRYEDFLETIFMLLERLYRISSRVLKEINTEMWIIHTASVDGPVVSLCKAGCVYQCKFE